MCTNIAVHVPRCGLLGLKSAFAALRVWGAALDDAIDLDDSRSLMTLTALIEETLRNVNDAVFLAPTLNFEDRQLLRDNDYGWVIDLRRVEKRQGR